jgi:transcriptional regulator with XRE-family HTH domain
LVKRVKFPEEKALNFSAFVRSRLAKLGYGQKDLAKAVQVTESYISQLLTRKKAPPGRDRTDIYTKMETFLKLRPGELARLVEIERMEEARRKLAQATEPLFREFRDLVLRKCAPDKRDEVRGIFEGRPFGTLERLVTQTLLKTVQRIARQELDSENWIRLAARVGGLSHEEMRVIVLEFLDTDVFHVSNENCVVFLDPLVESWDIDLDSLRLEIRLNRDLVNEANRTFAFVEGGPAEDPDSGSALAEFLKHPQLGSHVTEGEIRLLRSHRFGGGRPTKLYYYRALQVLRDPLHFRNE